MARPTDVTVSTISSRWVVFVLSFLLGWIGGAIWFQAEKLNVIIQKLDSIERRLQQR